MKLMIRFHDNDFYFTFHGVLTALATGDELGRDLDVLEKLTKAQLLEVINEITFGHYLLCQHQLREEMTKKRKDHLREYLTLNESQILLGGEVDEFLERRNHDGNCEWFVLDTDLWYYSDGKEGVLVY